MTMNSQRMNRKMRSSPKKACNTPIRTPKDDIFVLLSQLVELLREYLPGSFLQDVDRVIRTRSFEEYSRWRGRFSIQCITDLSDGSTESFRALYLLTSLLKKYQHPLYSPDPSTAFSKVMEGEQACRKANLRGRMQLSDPFVERIRRICTDVLGAFPDTDTLDEHSTHGPGTSLDCPYMFKDVYFKYTNYPYSVTPRMYRHAVRLIWSNKRWLGALEDDYRRKERIPAWSILNWDTFFRKILRVSDHNKITSVPKDLSTRRPIAIEGTVGIQLQLGVGKYIRSRLRRWGIDLNDQSVNRRLALEGSQRRDVLSPCTIDLANASDTVSLRACKAILPEDWYTYLCDIRSVRGKFPDGNIIRYRKISSMGNGYTFDLESLIFFCIAKAAVEYTIDSRKTRGLLSVFGDDIVVPEASAALTCHLLEYFGFTPNYSKSFTSGSFKESCGWDCWNGHHVRPVYMKHQLKFASDIYSIRNRLYRWFSMHYPWLDVSRLDDLFIKWLRNHSVLYGPCSNTEFDTYWHSPGPMAANSLDKNLSWTYKSISGRFPKFSREHYNSFFFRSLMFRGDSQEPGLYEALPSKGSIFDIHRPTTLKYSIVRRSTNYWGTTSDYHV